MKKFFALLLALTMVLSLAACGGKEETPAEKPAEGTEAPADALPGEGMEIALVTSKIGTQVFLLQMVEALNEAAEKYGFKATIVECADTAAFEENIRALVAEECDLIIGGGWEAGDALNKMAAEFPDAANYALIDSEVEAEAVKCISYYEQQGAYLIGMTAALVTDGESHTYGAVHVNEGAGSWKWRYGYMEGVKAIDPDAKFIFNYTASYSDPAKAKELAIQQNEQGAMFVNSACAAGDSGTFEAALEKGFYTSGQDVDLTDPSNPYIVTSQIKDTYQSVTMLIDEFFSDSYDNSNSTWGVAEGTIGAVHVTHESVNPIHERLSEEDMALLKQAAEDIASGKLDLINMPTEEEYNAG
ncbi:MAG: BMP family ABC transporter substrate-binding protein [Oscillibacter sp.]|nr:BMP family ABC transporter substrate-binding protein [Oscillibacter sp.]